VEALLAEAKALLAETKALLALPAVQYGAAPLAAGLAAALLLQPLRLAGLAVAAGFFAALYLAGRLDFQERLLIAVAAAAAFGALTDAAFRPTRAAGVLLGIAFGMAAFWVYFRMLGGKPPQELALYAVGITALTALVVVCSVLSLDEPARAGAAGIGLGAALGVGVWVFSLRFDLRALALAAACAGFVLLATVYGKGLSAGASFTLTSGVVASLLAVGAVLAGRLPWQAAAALVLVPMAVRLPVPERAPVAAQALAALLYALLAAGGVCAIAWYVKRGG
jgi:hypothetical protein